MDKPLHARRTEWNTVAILTNAQIDHLAEIARMGTARIDAAAEVAKAGAAIRTNAIDAVRSLVPVLRVATASGYSRTTIDGWTADLIHRARGDRFLGGMSATDEWRLARLSEMRAERTRRVAQLQAIEARLAFRCRQARYLHTPVSVLARAAGVHAATMREWVKGAPMETGRTEAKQARTAARAAKLAAN